MQLTDLKCATRRDLAEHCNELTTNFRNRPLTPSGAKALENWNEIKRAQRITGMVSLPRRICCFFRGHLKSSDLSHYNCTRCNAVIYRDGLKPSWE